MSTTKTPAWLDQVGFFSIDLGLDRVRDLLKRLGDPQNGLRYIHVAGSNGKGSVCVFTESALLRAGFKVGFYSSPHLVDLAERFRIGGKNVPSGELETVLEQMRPHIESMREQNNGPTYFEITTAAALLLFRRAEVDFVVWETGMGGRLDATNIVLPELAVITGISMEHTDHLGHTLGAIAGEKAGIIKPGVPVICGPLPEEAEKVIRSRAEEMKAPLTVLPAYKGAFRIERAPGNRILQIISVCGVELKTVMIGAYQRDNIRVAGEVVRMLADKFGFDLQNALKGFESAEWTARLQVIPEKKLIIDGAHNPGGAEALVKSLRELFPAEKLHFICGAFSDKDSRGVLSVFAAIASDFTFVPFGGAGRKVRTPEELGSVLKEISAIPWRASSAEKALDELPRPGWTVLTGSLHLCGHVLEYLGMAPE